MTVHKILMAVMLVRPTYPVHAVYVKIRTKSRVGCTSHHDLKNVKMDLPPLTLQIKLDSRQCVLETWRFD